MKIYFTMHLRYSFSIVDVEIYCYIIGQSLKFLIVNKSYTSCVFRTKGLRRNEIAPIS